MNKLLLFLGLNLLMLTGFTQSENELVNMVARICTTDSVTANLGYLDEDSVLTYQFMTPSFEEFGAPTFEYENFNLNFDVNSRLLFSQKPYGKIDIAEFSKKKSIIVIELAGLGDRGAGGLWRYSAYKFEKDKSGKWMLKGAKYFFDDYQKGMGVDMN